MKLSGFLNKPRWQAKEPAIRRAGVASDDDAELIANLATIARQDPDPGVRSAAMKRLADPALTQRLAQDDGDPGVRTDARKLWLDLLAGTHPRAPTPAECARLLRAQEDAALIEHVARTASDASLRGAALERVTRAALLAERATGDPSPELRLAALERIDDESLLERLAERTRKTDKRISRRARERADALRIARGDSGAVEALARSLCERMERLLREPAGGDAESDIDAQWTPIEPRAGDSLRVRYQAARKLIATSRDSRAPVAMIEPAHDAPLAESSAPTTVEPDASVAAESTAATMPETTPAAQTELAADGASSTPGADPQIAEARTAASLDAANADRKQQQEERHARMQPVENAIAAFEAAVDEGVVARAHVAHAEIAALRKSGSASLPRALQQRLADAERRYAELSQWQHWGDNQRRRQLCESIEELVGSGLHPDAIATRVREAQGEWTKLDAAEGHAGAGQAMHGWARRFHAACRHALEPARSYFKKRQELRKTHAQAIATALDAARSIPDDSTDWPLIAKSRHAVVDALRALDTVDPHERKTFARDLKAALTAIDARLAAHHGEIQRQKAALITEAEALAAGEPPRGAVASARTLQQRWRDVGNGRRDRDQAQWKAFRGALDAVFGKLDAERSQRSVRDADSRSRAAALCDELHTLAASTTSPQRAAVAKIESEWDALNVRDEALVRRFRAALGALRDAEMRRERTSRVTPYESWFTRYRLCRAAEMGAAPVDELRGSWDSSAIAEIAADALATRFGAAAEGAAAEGSDEEALRDVLIRLEVFGGLESPREDHDRRRALQVERLSARMRGGASQTPQQELAALLARWTELAPDAQFDARFERAFAAAIGTLP